MAKKYTQNKTTGLYTTLIWDGTYDADGKKHRKKLTSRKSSADLEKKVAAFRAEVEERGAAVSRISSTPFLVYARDWLTVSKASKELNTRNMYRRVVEKYFNTIADIPISEIRHSHFQAIINEQLDHPRTCQQIALTFRQVIRYAARNHHIPPGDVQDILGDITMPKYKKPQKRGLNAVEKQAIETAELDPRGRAFISILYFCGLRRGEALALTTEDFDWDESTLSVTKAVVFDENNPVLKNSPKSDRGFRTVPIPERAVPLIRPYVEEQTGFIFHGQNSAMMSKMAFRCLWEGIMKDLNKAAGEELEITPHMLRHNYCTELCYQIPRISTKLIARLLGDEEKMVMDIYSHICEEKEDISEALKNAF